LDDKGVEIRSLPLELHGSQISDLSINLLLEDAIFFALNKPGLSLILEDHLL